VFRPGVYLVADVVADYQAEGEQLAGSRRAAEPLILRVEAAQ